MSQCRIARRIALSVQVNNRCTQAVSAQTLATKSYTCCCSLFRSVAGRRGGDGWPRENL